MNRAALPPLSGRQAEIAELIVSGKSSREIALALVLSPRTVETHIAAIYNKFGVSSRVDLTRAVLAPNSGGDGRLGPPNASKTNIPQHRSSLVGREADVATIVDTLDRFRLVTLTGSGGVGKTRSALAVGEALGETTRARVCFVELAPVDRASLVAGAVARALNVAQSQDLTILEALVARLRHESPLLILDNCEHVIEETAAVANALLQGCPSLRILATSREPLRIAGERTYRLSSLRFPTTAEGIGITAARGAEFPAIELFTQRARAVDYNFRLDDDNAPSVAQICGRLDGIPLAIELAAARVNILPIRALLERLDRQLRLLSGGDRTASPRHRTMHALIDWSYDLLSSAERRLFERLSVFAGGCALAQITVVFGDEAVDEYATLELLSSLVDKSLVVADLTASEPRYDLLQSFRWYACEKLTARGEAFDVSHLHAIAYVELAEERLREYERISNAVWFARAHLELDNFRSVLAWSLEARGNALLGQRLAAAMRPLYAGAYEERHWLQLACDLASERTPAAVRADLEYAVAWMGYLNGAWETTIDSFLRLIDVYAQLGQPLRAAYVQTVAAKALMNAGRLVEGESLIADALEAARSQGSAKLIALICSAAAQRSFERGDLSHGRAQLAEALAIYENMGAELHAAALAGNLAEAEFRFGNVDEAERLGNRAMVTMRKLGHGTNDYFNLLNNLAAYRIERDCWDDACAYAREVLILAADSDLQGLVWALQHLAAVAVLSERIPKRAVTPLHDASRLLAYVDARITSHGFSRGFTEQHEYDRARRVLCEASSERELAVPARGAALTQDEAIALGLAIAARPQTLC